MKASFLFKLLVLTFYIFFMVGCGVWQLPRPQVRVSGVNEKGELDTPVIDLWDNPCNPKAVTGRVENGATVEVIGKIVCSETGPAPGVHLKVSALTAGVAQEGWVREKYVKP